MQEPQPPRHSGKTTVDDRQSENAPRDETTNKQLHVEPKRNQGSTQVGDMRDKQGQQKNQPRAKSNGENNQCKRTTGQTSKMQRKEKRRKPKGQTSERGKNVGKRRASALVPAGETSLNFRTKATKGPKELEMWRASSRKRIARTWQQVALATGRQKATTELANRQLSYGRKGTKTRKTRPAGESKASMTKGVSLMRHQGTGLSVLPGRTIPTWHTQARKGALDHSARWQEPEEKGWPNQALAWTPSLLVKHPSTQNCDGDPPHRKARFTKPSDLVVAGAPSLVVGDPGLDSPKIDNKNLTDNKSFTAQGLPTAQRRK